MKEEANKTPQPTQSEPRLDDSPCSGFRWTTEDPILPGWYWIKAPNLSERIVHFHRSRFGIICTNHPCPFRLHGAPYEYAGPIPSPNRANPPTELKSVVLGRENSRKKSNPPNESATCSTFRKAALKNSVVNRVLASGGSAEDAVVILVNQLDNAMKRIEELEQIAPKRMTVNGQDMVWRCPDHLIPSSDR